MRGANGRPLRTAWVLGAGFSRSLGGPLLPDLLRQSHASDLEARYPRIEFGDLADACRRAQTVYNWGKRIDGLWLDAEEFLEFVDRAEGDQSAARALFRLNGTATPMRENGVAPDLSDYPAKGR